MRRTTARGESAGPARQARSWPAVWGLLLLLVLFRQPALAEEQAVAVYVNASVRQQAISLGALRTIIGMRLRSWNDGSPIHVFVMPDSHPMHVDFCKRILGIFPHQLRWAWDRLVYSGTGQAPVQVNTEEQMRRMLATVPGAIGYLRREPNDDEIHALEIR